MKITCHHCKTRFVQPEPAEAETCEDCGGVFALCPKCGEPVRMSDWTSPADGAPPDTCVCMEQDFSPGSEEF
jgi:hypothetical protein